MMDPEEKFYAHLDLCEQCREHPFELCAVGDRLIVAAGNAAAASLGLPPVVPQATPEATVTGRRPSEPATQYVRPKTEFGDKLVSDFRKVFGEASPLVGTDFSELENHIITLMEPSQLKTLFKVATLATPEECPGCELEKAKKDGGKS